MSLRTIDAKIEGVELKVKFIYEECGCFSVESNWIATDPAETDLWELESPNVRRQIEHACEQSLARDGRL
jgi:hypothetical protein